MMISASILDSDNRINSVKLLNKTDVSYIHIDTMDGDFVPSVQFGDIEEIRNIGKVSKYPLDVHLMVSNPDLYIKALNDMNIEFITVHLEIDKDLEEIFSQIRGLGYKVGLSIKPSTDIKIIEPYLKMVDMILLMSVEPGLGGQVFMDSTIDRIKELKTLINSSGCNTLIEVDGGINNETIRYINDADIAVVGSYIIKSDDYKKRVESLLK